MYFTAICWILALTVVLFQTKAKDCKGRRLEAYTIALAIAALNIATFCINFMRKLALAEGAVPELIAIAILLVIAVYDMYKVNKISNQIEFEKEN